MAIASREYGNSVFWVYLYEENKDKIQDPDKISVGMVITIPPASKYGIDKDNPASVQAAKAMQQKIPRQKPSEQRGSPQREYKYDERGFPYY